MLQYLQHKHYHCSMWFIGHNGGLLGQNDAKLGAIARVRCESTRTFDSAHDS